MNNFTPSNSLTLSLTDLTNKYYGKRITKSQRRFLEIAYHINTIDRITFCVQDFREKGYSDTNFRQHIHNLKRMLVISSKSNPVFYQLKGVVIPGNSKNLTVQDMGRGLEMLHSALDELKQHVPMMHDIKLKFESENLHLLLRQNGYVPAKENSMIRIKHYFDEIGTDIIFTVYPKSTQIHISNTQKPIIHNPEGILKLGTILGHVRQFLIGKSHDIAIIPMCNEWEIYHYHLNKDSPAFSGKSVMITVGDFDSVLLRYYTKHMITGKTINRLEKIVTTKNSLTDLMNNALDTNLSIDSKS